MPQSHSHRQGSPRQRKLYSRRAERRNGALCRPLSLLSAKLPYI